ncbi:MAG TPA: hypothetical protein DCG57_04285 [Candidatus Riflebacteria bacterium]|nr:hypothetical protein [Candidatus Riflebacteria bacterium]
MITKEQWAEIEKDLAGYFGSKDFYLGKDKISVVREAYKEGDRRLVVYFNGILKWRWTHKPDEEHYNPLVEKFWRKTSRAVHDAKYKAAMTKIWGKRNVHKRCPELDRRIEWYLPVWPKAKALVGQLKKIKGLELIEPESKSQEASMV